jgi:hypothetical protein
MAVHDGLRGSGTSFCADTRTWVGSGSTRLEEVGGTPYRVRPHFDALNGGIPPAVIASIVAAFRGVGLPLATREQLRVSSA